MLPKWYENYDDSILSEMGKSTVSHQAVLKRLIQHIFNQYSIFIINGIL